MSQIDQRVCIEHAGRGRAAGGERTLLLRNGSGLSVPHAHRAAPHSTHSQLPYISAMTAKCMGGVETLRQVDVTGDVAAFSLVAATLPLLLSLRFAGMYVGCMRGVSGKNNVDGRPWILRHLVAALDAGPLV